MFTYFTQINKLHNVAHIRLCRRAFSLQIKLENFLFRDKDADSELVVIDFGLSKHFTFGEMQSDPVGTLYTVAPEVIRGRYDERCDVWAIGESKSI
jgi:serine/threonine protein kinase